jgi:hypothetical protein
MHSKSIYSLPRHSTLLIPLHTYSKSPINSRQHPPATQKLSVSDTLLYTLYAKTNGRMNQLLHRSFSSILRHSRHTCLLHVQRTDLCGEQQRYRYLSLKLRPLGNQHHRKKRFCFHMSPTRPSFYRAEVSSQVPVLDFLRQSHPRLEDKRWSS